MASKSSNRPPGHWSQRAKKIGLEAAKKMNGFNVVYFAQWVKDTYGECSINFSEVTEAAQGQDGMMQPILGSEKLFMNLDIKINHRPVDGTTLPQSIMAKLWELGIRGAAPMNMSSCVRNGETHVQLAVMLPNVEISF